MSLAISPARVAINPLLTRSFAGTGGTAPYAFSVASGGIGGTIDAASGLYTPPAAQNGVEPLGVDTVVVTDAAGARAQATVVVGTPLHLLADILQVELGLAQGRAWVYDQKINEPTDPGLYVVVGVLTDRILGTTRRHEDDGAGGLREVKTVNVVTVATIDLKSRSTAARDRRHEISTALRSAYAFNQQVANGFKIGPQPMSGPIDLSRIDGAAIPHWFQAQVRLHFSITKRAAVGTYKTFSDPTLLLNP